MNMKLIFSLLLLIISSGASAEVYKWVDKNGKVHYGDRPTSDQSTVEINIDHAAPASSDDDDDELSREEKRARLLQSMEEDRLEKEAQRKQQQANKEKDRKRCNYYRDKMRNFQRANSLYKLDKDGNRVYMSDADRAKATNRLQKKINKYCN